MTDATSDSCERKNSFRLQFGLRTILILILLVCVGSSVYRRYTAYMAIDAIQKKAGFVRPAPKATGWRRIFSNDVYKVHHLSFHSSFGVTDEDVAAITRLPWLRRLSLHRTAVTDKSANYVSKLKHLEALSFQGTPITDDGLAKLAKLRKLKSLSLKQTGITDAGLERLADLTEMEELLLQSTPITSLRPLRKMKKLRRLETSHRQQDTSSLRHLSDATDMETLQMDYMPLTRGDMVHHLSRLESLQSLSIWSAQLDFADAELWRAYPNLKGLKVNCLREFSMSDHQTIRNISINGTPKSIVLENLPELLSLNHYHAPVDELRVRNCEKLQSLSIKAKRSEIVNLPGVKTLTIGNYEAIQLASLPNVSSLSIAVDHLKKDLFESITHPDQIRFVSLRCPHRDAEAIEMLSRFPNLETLDLRWSFWDAETGAYLAKLPKLRSIVIYHANVAREFLEQLAASQTLEKADVTATNLRVADCEVVLGAPNLETMIIQARRESGQGYRIVRRSYKAQVAGPAERMVEVKGRTFLRVY